MKVMAPTSSPAFHTQVTNSTEEISQLIDVAVDTKYGSNTTNTAHTMTEALEKLNRKRENILHPRINSNSNQGGRNYVSSSANNFVSSVATHGTLTSVSQNFSSHDRSVGFNFNLQQPSYQTVAYNTSPLPPIGTGVPDEPIPDAYFNGSPQQTTHAQITLPEMCVPPATQISSP